MNLETSDGDVLEGVIDTIDTVNKCVTLQRGAKVLNTGVVLTNKPIFVTQVIHDLQIFEDLPKHEKPKPDDGNPIVRDFHKQKKKTPWDDNREGKTFIVS